MANTDERASGRKLRVRVSWLNKYEWLCKFASGLVVKYKLLKSKQVRVSAVYFSGNQQSMAASLDRLHSQNFEFRAERREAKYCKGSEEYRITAKVAMLAKVEEFVITGFIQKWQSKIVPIGDRVQQVVTIGRHTVNIA